ncbi:hypothetical protein HDU67_006051 [Dinochytrium kinnereticum]|nr:hypothetical protein HDU67_006051 [Dinochytrium kinnereticum]
MDIYSLKVAELKDELVRRNIDCKALRVKKDLISKLEEAIRDEGKDPATYIVSGSGKSEDVEEDDKIDNDDMEEADAVPKTPARLSRARSAKTPASTRKTASTLGRSVGKVAKKSSSLTFEKADDKEESASVAVPAAADTGDSLTLKAGEPNTAASTRKKRGQTSNIDADDQSDSDEKAPAKTPSRRSRRGQDAKIVEEKDESHEEPLGLEMAMNEDEDNLQALTEKPRSTSLSPSRSPSRKLSPSLAPAEVIEPTEAKPKSPSKSPVRETSANSSSLSPARGRSPSKSPGPLEASPISPVKFPARESLSPPKAVSDKSPKSPARDSLAPPESPQRAARSPSRSPARDNSAPPQSPARAEQSPSRSPMRETLASSKTPLRASQSPSRSPLRDTLVPPKSPEKPAKSPPRSPKSPGKPVGETPAVSSGEKRKTNEAEDEAKTSDSALKRMKTDSEDSKTGQGEGKFEAASTAVENGLKRKLSSAEASIPHEDKSEKEKKLKTDSSAAVATKKDQTSSLKVTVSETASTRGPNSGAAPTPASAATPSSATTPAGGDPNHPPTATILMRNLVRPLNEKALQAKLGESGEVVKFWIDKIKTHCYVTFNSIESAEKAKQSFDGIQYPPETGRIVSVFFIELSEAEKLIAEYESKAPSRLPRPVPPPATTTLDRKPLQASNPTTSASSLSFIGRSNGAGPIKTHAFKAALNGAVASRGETGHGISHDNDTLVMGKPPLKSVDVDKLFKRTETTPRLYYLPLSDKEVEDKRSRGEALFLFIDEERDREVLKGGGGGAIVGRGPSVHPDRLRLQEGGGRRGEFGGRGDYGGRGRGREPIGWRR